VAQGAQLALAWPGTVAGTVMPRARLPTVHCAAGELRDMVSGRLDTVAGEQVNDRAVTAVGPPQDCAWSPAHGTAQKDWSTGAPSQESPQKQWPFPGWQGV
jgi:hypothetical protein